MKNRFFQTTLDSASLSYCGVLLSGWIKCCSIISCVFWIFWEFIIINTSIKECIGSSSKVCQEQHINAHCHAISTHTHTWPRYWNYLCRKRFELRINFQLTKRRTCWKFKQIRFTYWLLSIIKNVMNGMNFSTHIKISPCLTSTSFYSF